MSSPAYFIIVVIGFMVLGDTSSTDVSRQKRDDAHKVTISTIVEEPYLMLKKPGGTGNDNFIGLIPDMMKHIGDKLKLNYVFRLVDDNRYGTDDDSGKWNGMIGEVIDGTADMAAAPLTVSDKRRKVVDFTIPFEKFHTTLLMLKPAEGTELAVKNMDDLAKQTDVSYGMVRDGNTYTFFKSSNYDTYKKIWDTTASNPQNMVDSVEKGVERVRSSNGKYAFIMESATAEYWVNKPPCDIVMVGDVVNSNEFAFAFKPEYEYKEQIDEVLTEMMKNGELNKLRNKWKKGECDYKIYQDIVSASPPSVYGSEISRQVAVMTVLAAIVSLL